MTHPPLKKDRPWEAGLYSEAVELSNSDNDMIPSNVSHLAQLRTRGRSATRARREFLVAKLHALGPAPLGHLLAEIEAGADLRRHLERYATPPADFIKLYGGDQFPSSLHFIDGGRGYD
jgi:hypothetical protein